MFKLDLEKAEEPEIKLQTSIGSCKKQENSRKTSTSALLTMLKAFDCVDPLSSGTGLEKVSFHSNPKERQCQRMLKLPHNCTHLTR